MAYENTKVVKTLRFPGDDANQYQINAVALEGLTKKEIEDRFDLIESFDALRYMGTVTAGATAPGAFTPKADKGDTYKVIGSGYVNGVKVENGDMLICNTDNTSAADTSSYIALAEKWDIIQVNIDEEALLDHYHTGTVDLQKTEKTLTHTVDYTKETITAEFKNGTASVTGDHEHTASGSVKITPAGTISVEPITPAGSIAVDSVTTDGTVEESTTQFMTSATAATTIADHKGTTDGASGGTASGTITSTVENVVTGVSVEKSISAHTGSSDLASAGTPEGDVTIDKYTPSGTITAIDYTPAGTVASHKHDVAITTTPEDVLDTPTYSNDGMDGILTFGSSSVVKSASISEEKSVAPAFTGTADRFTPEFTGTEATLTASFDGKAMATHNHELTISDHELTISVTPTTAKHSHTFVGNPLDEHTHGITLSHSNIVTTITPTMSSHTHEFTGSTQSLKATFTGTSVTPKATFTGTQATHDVDVTVNGFTGSFTGTSAGQVALTNATGVVKEVVITDHKISTVDSASVTTGSGKQGE